MTRQIRIVKRDEKGQAAVLELDGGKDPAQRDAEQAHMIGQHVGHVVGSIVSEAVQHIDTRPKSGVSVRSPSGSSKRLHVLCRLL